MLFRGDVSTSILAIEVCKFLAALFWWVFFIDSKEEVAVRDVGKALRFVASSLRYLLPSVLYLMMNSIMFFMISEYGALNTVLVLSLKIPATGLLAYILLGRGKKSDAA